MNLASFNLSPVSESTFVISNTTSGSFLTFIVISLFILSISTSNPPSSINDNLTSFSKSAPTTTNSAFISTVPAVRFDPYTYPVDVYI